MRWRRLTYMLSLWKAVTFICLKVSRNTLVLRYLFIFKYIELNRGSNNSSYSFMQEWLQYETYVDTCHTRVNYNVVASLVGTSSRWKAVCIHALSRSLHCIVNLTWYLLVNYVSLDRTLFWEVVDVIIIREEVKTVVSKLRWIEWLGPKHTKLFSTH